MTKSKEQVIKWQDISLEHQQLVKEYCSLLGYECIIDNKTRKAVIIDQNKSVGLIQVIDGVLCYYYKGTFEEITTDIAVLKRSLKYMPLSIVKKIFGITNFEIRNPIYKRTIV